MLWKLFYLDLQEDICNFLHLSELIIELGVIGSSQLLTHQLIRLEERKLSFLQFYRKERRRGSSVNIVKLERKAFCFIGKQMVSFMGG